MSGDTRLSVIAEDGDVQPAPPIPPKAAHRPLAKRFHLGDPPRHSYEKPPPPYSVWTNVTGPKGERLVDVRRKPHIVRRGGWRRLCVVAFVVIALLVGLIVGLVVGLRKKNSNESVFQHARKDLLSCETTLIVCHSVMRRPLLRPPLPRQYPMAHFQQVPMR